MSIDTSKSNSITVSTYTKENAMEIFKPKCNSCDHSAVCKFKREYKKLLSSIEDTYAEYKNSDIFKIELDCEYYKSNYSSYTIKTDPNDIRINPCAISIDVNDPCTKTYYDKATDINHIYSNNSNTDLIGTKSDTNYITNEDLKKIQVE